MPNPRNPNDILGLLLESGPINNASCTSPDGVLHLIRPEMINLAEFSIVPSQNTQTLGTYCTYVHHLNYSEEAKTAFRK